MRFAFVIAIVMAVGCGASFGRQRASGAPTCEAVCDYYTGCRNIEARATLEACVTECREIFYEDGEPDKRSLRQFQRLECSEAIGFVEGSSGRPPGSPATASQEKK